MCCHMIVDTNLRHSNDAYFLSIRVVCLSFSCLLSVFQMSMFFMCLFNCVSTGQNSETLWEIWGRIINDWEPVKKKPAFLKVCQS